MTICWSRQHALHSWWRKGVSDRNQTYHCGTEWSQTTWNTRPSETSRTLHISNHHYTKYMVWLPRVRLITLDTWALCHIRSRNIVLKCHLIREQTRNQMLDVQLCIQNTAHYFTLHPLLRYPIIWMYNSTKVDEQRKSRNIRPCPWLKY